jgi:hypothetical protein
LVISRGREELVDFTAPDADGEDAAINQVLRLVIAQVDFV